MSHISCWQEFKSLIAQSVGKAMEKRHAHVFDIENGK